MGSVVRLESGKWQARWRDPAGKQCKKSFVKKGDAQRHVTTVEASKVTGGYVDVSDRTTLAEYARAWAAARPHRSTTAARVRSNVKVHIAGTRLGGMRLAAVRPSDVQAWATDRSQHLAPLTTRNLLGLLRSVFAAAVLDRLIATTPVVRVQLPRAERPRVVPLTVEQVRALADAMPERHRALVVVQASLGLRLGELLALRVEDVDFLRRVVHVRWQFASGIRERVPPKTPRSRRGVPLPQVAADALAAHLAAFAPAADGTIFTGANGLPHRCDGYGTRVFRRAVEAAGVPEGTTSHDLRHHYASVLLAAGESVVAVAERLGHDDASLVLKTYGHLMPDSEDRTRRAVDEAWCAPDVPRQAADVR